MLTNMKDMSNLINMIRNGNPKEITMNMLQESMAQGNPMAANLFQLAQANNTKEIEKIARNIAREKGIDFDKEFNSFKQMFRL